MIGIVVFAVGGWKGCRFGEAIVRGHVAGLDGEVDDGGGVFEAGLALLARL